MNRRECVEKNVLESILLAFLIIAYLRNKLDVRENGRKP